MRSAPNSTSSLAIIEAWKRKQQLQHLELSLIGWLEYYIPDCLVVVRPLTPTEHQRYQDQIDDNGMVVYGAFHARSAECGALSESRENLLRQAKERGLSVAWLH